MKALLIGSVALVAIAPAIAQVAAAPAPAPHAGKAHTRAELQAKVAEHFARLDSNRDGFVTTAEVQAGREALRAQRAERREQRRAEHRERAFDRLDSNDDGAINRAEWDAVRGQRRHPMVHRGAGGMLAMRALHGRMFETADVNKDGRVSLQEAQAAALQHFDMVDANRDGQITREERMQMRQRMREQHRRS